MVEREPVTVVVSEKGWIRALRGQVADLSGLAFKADDRLKLAFFAETTSKLLVFATNGRCYTIEAAKLPGGRGHGEPIRLYIDLEQEADVISRVPLPGRPQADRGEPSRAGALSSPRTSASPIPARASRSSTSSRPTRPARSRRPRANWSPRSATTAKCWCFRSIRCRRWRAAAACACSGTRTAASPTSKVFEAEKGLTWTDSAGRVFTLSLKELADWRGNRADAGRLAPKGFPKTNKFDDA